MALKWLVARNELSKLFKFKISIDHLSEKRYPTISALGPLLKQNQKKVAADAGNTVPNT